MTALREIKLLKELRSPSIVRLLDVFPHKRNLSLVRACPRCGLSSHTCPLLYKGTHGCRMSCTFLCCRTTITDSFGSGTTDCPRTLCAWPTPPLASLPSRRRGEAVTFRSCSARDRSCCLQETCLTLKRPGVPRGAESTRRRPHDSLQVIYLPQQCRAVRLWTVWIAVGLKHYRVK